MAQPLVSILIPVYNREKIVSRAIDSALAQTYRNIEIIICDNASTDGTWSVLQEYAEKDNRVKIFRNETNVGPVRNWKECLNHATGEYVKFLWSDDEILPTFVETMLRPVLNDPQVGFAWSDITIRADDYECTHVYHIGKEGLYKGMHFIKEAFKKQSNMPVSPGCALFRKSDIEQFLICDIPNKEGLVCAKYGAGNDLLLFLQPAYKYPYFYYTPQDLSIFYASKDSFTVNNNLLPYYKAARFYFLRGKWNISYLRIYNAMQGKECNIGETIQQWYTSSKRSCKKLVKKLIGYKQ